MDKSIQTELNKRILILDGGMGSEIIKHKLTEKDYHLCSLDKHQHSLKGCFESLCISNPKLIYKIHAEYLKAGADIIETNSFNANAVSLKKYDLSDFDASINSKAAQIARKAVDDHLQESGKQCFVAGAIGPSDIMVNDEESENYQKLSDAYFSQTSALIEGGVDMLLVETIIGLANASAACEGIHKALQFHNTDLLLLCSATINTDRNLIDGTSLSDFIDFCNRESAFAVGLNCGSNIQTTMECYEQLVNDNRLASKYLALYPSAGMPDPNYQYKDTETVLKRLEDCINGGKVNIVGGCCGTTPQFTEHLCALSNLKKRRATTE